MIQIVDYGAGNLFSVQNALNYLQIENKVTADPVELETEGLGLIPGCVQLIDGGGLKIPHMGWNDLTVLHDCALSADVQNGDYVYFVHSYRAETDERYISCYTVYNEKIPGLVFCGNVYGAQFHPEKSGQVGMGILKNFAKLVTA